MIAPLLVFESAALVTIPACMLRLFTQLDITCDSTHLGRNTLSGSYDLESAREVVAEIKKSESRKIMLFGPNVVDAFGLLSNSKPLDVYEDGYRSYIVLPDAMMFKWWNSYDDLVIDRLKALLKDVEPIRKHL